MISTSPLEYQKIKDARGHYEADGRLCLNQGSVVHRYRLKSGHPRYGEKTTLSTYRTDRDISNPLKYK